MTRRIMALTRAEVEKAKREGHPYCKEHGETEVVFHKNEETNEIEEGCELRGCCYPCLRKGVIQRAYNPGRAPPKMNEIKCTWEFHDYLYYEDVTGDAFLKGRHPKQITEEEARMLKDFTPPCEKEECFYIFP